MANLKRFFTPDKKEIKIDPSSIGSGGEAVVYKIIRPLYYKGNVLKVFNKDSGTIREKKLKALVDIYKQKSVCQTLVLPKELVYNESGSLIGFIMDLVETDDKDALRKIMSIDGNDFYSHKRASIRLSIGLSLANSIKVAHSLGLVICDLKPENILLSKTGTPYLIDLDSSQIYYQGTLFESSVNTEEYAPPEYLKKQLPISESWDYFSYAILLYQILFGIHPFLATQKKHHNKNDTDDNIRKFINNGWFVHGAKRKHLNLSSVHNAYYNFDKSVHNKFLLTLEKGALTPYLRTNVQDWIFELGRIQSTNKDLFNKVGASRKPFSKSVLQWTIHVGKIALKYIGKRNIRTYFNDLLLFFKNVRKIFFDIKTFVFGVLDFLFELKDKINRNRRPIVVVLILFVLVKMIVFSESKHPTRDQSTGVDVVRKQFKGNITQGDNETITQVDNETSASNTSDNYSNIVPVKHVNIGFNNIQCGGINVKVEGKTFFIADHVKQTTNWRDIKLIGCYKLEGIYYLLSEVYGLGETRGYVVYDNISSNSPKYTGCIKIRGGIKKVVEWPNKKFLTCNKKLFDDEFGLSIFYKSVVFDKI